MQNHTQIHSLYISFGISHASFLFRLEWPIYSDIDSQCNWSTTDHFAPHDLIPSKTIHTEMTKATNDLLLWNLIFTFRKTHAI